MHEYHCISSFKFDLPFFNKISNIEILCNHYVNQDNAFFERLYNIYDDFNFAGKKLIRFC